MTVEGLGTELPVAGRPRVPVSRAISGYLTAVMAATEQLIFGNPHGFRFDHRLALHEVWVPQEVTIVDGGRALATAEPRERIRLIAHQRVQIDAVLNMSAFHQSVIIGRPGYGKTTLCRRLAYKHAQTAKVNSVGWIPVMIDAHMVNQYGMWTSLEDLLGRLEPVQQNVDLLEQLAEASAHGQLWFFVDGLDEVAEPHLPELRSRLNSEIIATPNRVTVTCRLADYLTDRPLRRLTGLPILDLSPFSEEGLDHYIENWHRRAGRGRPPRWSEARLAATRALLDAHSELRDLASSPLLAAVLCVAGSRPVQAVVGRAALLKGAIDYLLLRPEWRHDSASGPNSVDQDVLLEIAGRLAFSMLAGRLAAGSVPARQTTVDRLALRQFVADQLQALETADPGDSEEFDAATSAYVDRLIGRHAAGLIQERKAGSYEFVHRSFQEYLAAEYLARHVRPQARLDLALRPMWREVFTLSASIAQMARMGLTEMLILVRTLLRNASDSLPVETDAAACAAGACLAAEMLAELGRPAALRYGLSAAVSGRPSVDPDDPTFAGLWTLAVNTVFALACDARLPRIIRIRALCVVSWLRDPRFRDEDGNGCGDLGALVAVPGGRGRVGTDTPLLMREPKKVPSSPAATVQVEPFHIGLRPITNVEYAEFIDDGGYDEPRWWQSAEATRWRSGDPAFIAELVELWEQQKDLNFVKEFGEPEFAGYAEKASTRLARRIMDRRVPLFWRDSRFNLPTAPVVGVNLWEAMAYCRWLQEYWRSAGRIGPHEVITLPTEIEWEWAAARAWTGNPRTYPWGDRFDQTQCLIRDFTNQESPEIVHFGAVPVGFWSLIQPPDGPEDMGGNVWEWVTSLPLPWNDQGDRERAEGLDKRGVRGGSWFSREPMATHVSFRLDDPPCNAYWDLGFRIVVRQGAQRG
jgi:formylglycine-generating enzyme required for sulfatase activity